MLPLTFSIDRVAVINDVAFQMLTSIFAVLDAFISNQKRKRYANRTDKSQRHDV